MPTETDIDTDTNGPYTIMIDEFQRRLLETTLHRMATAQAQSADPVALAVMDRLKELEQMFKELPEVAKDGPKNMVHGFCL